MPVSLHKENSHYNAMMAKCRAKPHHRGFVRIMKPAVVLKMLSDAGINITIRTLQRYAEDGLIDKPRVKSAGRGRGMVSEWPEDALAQFFASWMLRNSHKLKPKIIRAALDFRRSLNDGPDRYLDEDEYTLFEYAGLWRYYYKIAVTYPEVNPEVKKEVSLPAMPRLLAAIQRAERKNK